MGSRWAVGLIAVAHGVTGLSCSAYGEQCGSR